MEGWCRTARDARHSAVVTRELVTLRLDLAVDQGREVGDDLGARLAGLERLGLVGVHGGVALALGAEVDGLGGRDALLRHAGDGDLEAAPGDRGRQGRGDAVLGAHGHLELGEQLGDGGAGGCPHGQRPAIDRDRDRPLKS